MNSYSNTNVKSPSPVGEGWGGVALIFAAGLGTRLKPLTDTMPKALVPVCGQPLLWHVLTKLRGAGYREVVINLHHFADQIVRWCEQHPVEGMTIRFSDEREQLLETGGGVKHAIPLLCNSSENEVSASSNAPASSDEQAANDRILIHNVDILSNTDLAAFGAAFRGEATLLVSERETQRYLLFDDDMRLVGWTNIKTGEVRSPYPDLDPSHCRRLAFAGIHQLGRSLLPLMQDWPDRFGIMDFYLSICRDHPIYGHIQTGLRLMDVGKLDTLQEAERFAEEIEH